MGQSLKLLIFLQLFSYLVNYISAFNGVNLFYENSSNNLLYRITKIQRLDPLYSLTSISTSIIVLVLLHKHWAIQKFLEKWSCNDFWTDSVFFWVQNYGASWWADELYVLSETKKYGVLWPFKRSSRKTAQW